MHITMDEAIEMIIEPLCSMYSGKVKIEKRGAESSCCVQSESDHVYITLEDILSGRHFEKIKSLSGLPTPLGERIEKEIDVSICDMNAHSMSQSIFAKCYKGQNMVEVGFLRQFNQERSSFDKETRFTLFPSQLKKVRSFIDELIALTGGESNA